MKASYRWLLELVPGLDASARDVAARLTGGGLEVESITEYGLATESCVLARVESTRPHPSKSGLRLVTVDRGGAKQELVCGAPNVPEPGWLVVLAPLGTHLPAKNLTIGKRAIGGVESEGMLCSESELGLGDDHDGILVFPPGFAEPGTIFAKAVPAARDTIFEIGLTPNRPDGLGHVGLARELAAHYNLRFQWPDTGLVERTADVDTSALVTIAVEDAERCPHFGAAGAVDVTIAPSPLWLRYRLQALGVRSISNVVDVTNLVMLEYGHPMHAFDLDRVRGGRIVVRRAKSGEKLVTLDGVEHELDTDDVVVCDAEGPTGLAGIMGGQVSEIADSTKRVLFECAWWQPRGIRRTGRRHGIHTDASHRFERGVDTDDVARVLGRAVALTTAIAGAKATRGRIHVQGARIAPEPKPSERPAIRLRAHRIGDLLGVEVPFSEAIAVLERLGCEVPAATAKAGECDVIVPTHRPDLAREADLIEEIIRIRGIDTVKAELPAIRASRDVGGREELLSRVRAAATSVGLSEAITYSFTSRATLEALRAPKPSVVIKNPLGEHHAVMRTTLLSGLLDVVRNARRHGERDARLFTIGPVFLQGEGLPREELRVAFVLAGDRPGWLSKPHPVDVWDAKGYAIALATRLAGATPSIKADPSIAHLHPRGAASLSLESANLGVFGPLHPDVVDALELDGEVMVGEFAIEPFLAGPRLPQYTAIPRFPAATRDIALVVKDGIAAGDVERAVREAAGPLAEAVQIFDRFVGGPVPEGYSNLAFHIVYRAADRTLTDAEVDAAHQNVKKAAEERFGATLRQ